MAELRKQFIKELKRLEEIRDRVSRSLESAPDGYLRLSKTRGNTQYYYCAKETTRCGKYIPKNNIKLAERLAQKSYDEKIFAYAEKTSIQIAKLLNTYTDNKLEEIYTSEHPERQKLITPVEPTFKQRQAKWMSIPYTGKGFAENSTVILTNSGVRVRSKSEKIIADYLELMGISYKYECPITLKSYGTVYPDFTILSPKTGREIYWEHEGMLDNPEYAKTAALKVESYEKSGIFPGENLILTFETSSAVINTELIKILTNRYLI